MTDIPNEAVEAALDAMCGADWRSGHNAKRMRASMSHALAAADAKRWRPISEARAEVERLRAEVAKLRRSLESAARSGGPLAHG